MKHLTLNLECWIDMEVLDYLMQLDGVDKAEVNEDKDTLDIYFDDKIIPLKILVMEVELFLKIDKIPSIIGFDKNSDKELVKKTVTVDDNRKELKYKLKLTPGENKLEIIAYNIDGIKSKHVKVKCAK